MAGAVLTPQQFVAKWRGVRQNERAVAQQHFLDLCALFGQPPPAAADPTGAWFTFEKGVTKTGGGQGFADVWRRGHFAWEYKGRHKDLVAAYRQLLLYREPLENPPLLVVCDIERYEVHTNFTGTAKRVYRFTNEELAAAESLHVLRALFDEPEALRPGTGVEQVTQEAAGRFAALADGLRARGIEAHRAAHFLTQLLFCLFAEDIGLLPRGMFARVARRAVERPATFVPYVADLFAAMRDGGEFAFHDIARFNGGLFADLDVIELTPPELATLAEAAALDWGSIEPAIIGTLFERSLDPAKRSQLGAHYTSRDEIRLIVEPVVLAPLRREWDAVRARAEHLRAAAEAAPTPQTRRNRQAELARELLAFKERLAAVRVLDPACGSGNFLTVALGALLDLEKEVVTYGAAAGLPATFPEVSPRQLAGLEVNAYAHELAQVAVWIAYLQWMTANGFQPRRDPVLQALDTIRERDAVLDRAEPGCPREPEWPEADFIIGNPPYLGGKLLRTGLGDAYVDDLFAVYAGRVPREADLVCYFFEKARAQIEAGRARRAGLLATNSIRGGANRRVLERIKASGDIFMAWADEPWVLDGAAVRISLVGFDDGAETQRTLDGRPVPTINADLTGSADITVARRLPENGDLAFMGDTKGGPFDIPGDLPRRWLALPANPNGRPNSDVVRPWVNGLDITRRPRDMWIVDFGVDMPEAEAALYEAPFEYVREHVKPARATNNRAAYRERWWLHVEARSGMRAALNGLSRFICTPTVAKHRLFVWSGGSTLPDHQLIVFARADDYFFGVLHSRAHELWSLRMCTWLGVGNDPRYTPTTTFETFPCPWPPGREPADDPRVAAIARAARDLVEKRDRWLNPPGATAAELKKRTLTNLYNERPAWLDLAHRALDRAVLDAYGWPHDLSDEDLLTRLLALNVERGGGGGTGGRGRGG
ncbi:MAG TPA: DNA methyltransferase [Thermomicrobiales bacterium]|nr:DNA methyltransferase [Thermomicrobiales bacterium]